MIETPSTCSISRAGDASGPALSTTAIGLGTGTRGLGQRRRGSGTRARRCGRSRRSSRPAGGAESAWPPGCGRSSVSFELPPASGLTVERPRVAADLGRSTRRARASERAAAASCMARIVAAARVRAQRVAAGRLESPPRAGGPAIRRRPRLGHSVSRMAWDFCDRARVRDEARVDARVRPRGDLPAGDARPRPPGVPAHRAPLRSRSRSRGCGRRTSVPSSAARATARSSSA